MEKMTLPNALLMSEIELSVISGERALLRVKGGSMRTFLRDGRDIVELAADAGRLKRGDVVLFRHSGRHILHRIRRVDGNRLTISGDGNWRVVEIATRGDVAARVIAVIRGEKRIEAGSCRWRAMTIKSLIYKRLRGIKRTICG